jgi:serine/threonine-protein kinase
VCRVFDIGEAATTPFLTMEYVDGEDLASLLTRIGRLPQDKAVDISRQLCAGLAAAHEAGVLHRDLKPANIMLDRRGKVRITDFGLAGLAVLGGDEIRAGTPAYMAPEQLEGEAATAQSDIYSLGLVLYEIFTGKRVFDGSTLAELIRQHESTTPTSPAQLVAGLDPLVERVILRCLENQPRDRPHSALQVAAALPGGDPLAAALAAGETPSPEMVAAAGGEGVLQPKTAIALLIGALLIFAVILILAPFSTDLGLAPPRKTLGELDGRAEDIIENAGYSGAAADRASWFERNYDFLRYRAQQFPTSSGRRNLAHAELGILTYFFRQSPAALVPLNQNFRVGSFDPPYEVSGMVTVVLDASGRLVGFLAVPPQVEQPSTEVHDPNWNQMLAATGLNTASLTSVEPNWLPPTGFDRRFGWHGFYPEDPNTEIQISAASYRGKPVYFHVIGPWSQSWRMPSRPKVRARVVGDTTLLIGGFVTLIVAALFARHNVRLARSDRRGAFRISAFMFFAAAVSGLLVAHHVADLAAEWQIFVHIIGAALFLSMFVWLYYLALEPFVRRKWPELLISWTRLLAGEFRDPLVGRDLLTGVFFGGLMALGVHVTNSLPTWFNLSGQTTIPTSPLALATPQDTVGLLVGILVNAIFPAFSITFTLFLMRALLRNYWLSVIATAVVVLLVGLGGENFILETPFAIVSTIIMMFVLLRWGILALAVASFSNQLLTSYPVTLNLSLWFAPHSIFMFLVLLAMLLYGLRVATGNRPLLTE